jgi:phosphopantothenoylcysteine decarboxylase / phosphopantothenate---cysteine ligase
LARGVYLLGPAEGNQACGEVGPGRVLEPLEIIAAISESIFPADTLKGIRIVVTAGPTQEPIDPIRFMSNHSSGKMGYALAAAASNAGAAVTLISGPTHLDCPSGVQRICVTTAQQMYDVVMNHVPDCEIFIAAAAVADYHCKDIQSQKIKKDQEALTLSLEKNPDILSAVAHLKKPPFTVGFAAETENLFQNARIKLEQKNLDMIAANDVSQMDAGFNSEKNALTVLWKHGEKEFSLRSKKQLAKDFLDLVLQLYREK